VNERLDCAVIVIGAGPCGLMLAIELGRRGIFTILLEENISSARFPAANATQARTMEHYRRLGFAHFQLPTILSPMNAPNSMSVRRDNPRHMTMLPGAGSFARAR
jgi:2-polyprenyl-6-methoxyphenol hydroxylase-like FAD-dependent oxidoreductase